MDMTHFEGRIGDQQTTDRKVWPKLVKDGEQPVEPFTRGGKPVKIQMGYNRSLGNSWAFAPLRPIVLTALEKEWLGANVTSDALAGVWQVWSLALENRYVWLVRDGEFRNAHVDSLTRVPA